MSKTHFPCPICKGVGDFQDGDFVDVGIGEVQVSAHNPCGYCEEQGMIEIRGKVHTARFAEKIALQLISFAGTDREYSNEEVTEIGRKALLLVAPNQ